MSLPLTLVGTSFTADKVSLGSVTGTGPLVFTESKLLANQNVLGTPIGPNATATVTAVGAPDGTGQQSFTAVINGSPATFANGQTITGTVIGNDITDFIVTGTAAGTSGTFYVTNTAAQQPGVGNSATVQAASAGVAFTPACYCAGTLITTERGDIRVEDLAIGDRVLTVSGALRPIRWIGTRSYQGRFLAGHDHLLPIRFRAGSLGDNTPRRDLLVSPKHAMFLDGALVAAELLVNGTTVTREHGATLVEYVHVELAQHDVIWAEGAASETFIDDGSRGMFHNADTFQDLYPDAAAATVEYCAPRVVDGFALEAIRQAIEVRAGVVQAA